MNLIYSLTQPEANNATGADGVKIALKVRADLWSGGRATVTHRKINKRYQKTPVFRDVFMPFYWQCQFLSVALPRPPALSPARPR